MDSCSFTLGSFSVILSPWLNFREYRDHSFADDMYDLSKAQSPLDSFFEAICRYLVAGIAEMSFAHREQFGHGV